MDTKRLSYRLIILTLLITTLILANCSSTETTEQPTQQMEQSTQQVQQPEPTKTPTPTTVVQQEPEPTLPQLSPCQGITGEFEMQVLVGPADAVGMSPEAVGSIPFSVNGSEPPYTITGGGPIDYQETLTEEWGTYTVIMNLDNTLEGECVESDGGGELHTVLTMSGSQMVEVRSPDFSGDYPWEGTNTFEIVFPLEEGATSEGEGWILVLHLE